MSIIEAMARAMCTRPERIDPEAASMGQDGFVRPAIANRMIELRAALAEAERRGWVMVPKEPTEAMMEAAWVPDVEDFPDEPYKAMLAAAPKAEDV